MAYNERINATTLNAKYKDGQILHHTDMNEIVSVLKEGINANYDDIQGLENGDISSGNAKKIDGSSISRYLDETLKDDDNKIPSSQQVKQYVDAKFNNVNPKKGVDYWTPSDKSEVANDVVNMIIPDANNEFNKNVTAKTEAFNDNASDKTTDFNNNANTKTNNFNTNATTKTSAYDNNADEKLTAYNKNDTEKLNAYNSNASSKISDFNTNSTEKSTSYNNNASEKLNSFNSNSRLKVEAFNNNAIEKTNEFNKNATEYFETYKAELKGEKGEKGDTGANGSNGTDGKSATITIGTVTTLDAGSSATVENVGTDTDAIFNIGIPKGADGSSGTGNVSSDTINSIMVVDELPETEVEGVLYLVKEALEPVVVNLYPSQVENTETNGFTVTFKERNVIANGSNDGASVWGWTNHFNMNLEANKTYYLQFTNLSGSFDDSKRISQSDGIVNAVMLAGYDESGGSTNLINSVERTASGIYEKYTFTPTTTYSEYSLSMQVKKLNVFTNWTCSIVIAEESV